MHTNHSNIVIVMHMYNTIVTTVYSVLVIIVCFSSCQVSKDKKSKKMIKWNNGAPSVTRSSDDRV